VKGIVIKSTGSWFTVKYEEGIIPCKVKGNFRIKGLRTTNPVAVGDSVEFEASGNNTGLIFNIGERKNYIIRKSSNLSKEAQIIAANIDQAFLVVTLAFPETTMTFIDRFLVSAEAYKIPVKIIINKVDLYTPEQLQQLANFKEMYGEIGYPCIDISCQTGHNIDTVNEETSGKVCVFSGNSGVGKSTLLNCLSKNLDRKTGEISDYHNKGKHTTTFAEMFELENGGSVIDTPGIKGFGVIDMENENISIYFPEMLKKLGQCQFYNCTHTHEPGCAVKSAIESGEISLSRYQSYLSLLEIDEKYRRH
jgi:ribosome biogenesis GTPase / thiamine phosphate phosphatase